MMKTASRRALRATGRKVAGVNDGVEERFALRGLTSAVGRSDSRMVAGRRSPVAGRRSPVAGRRSPVAGRFTISARIAGPLSPAHLPA